MEIVDIVIIGVIFLIASLAVFFCIKPNMLNNTAIPIERGLKITYKSLYGEDKEGRVIVDLKHSQSCLVESKNDPKKVKRVSYNKIKIKDEKQD